MQILLSSVNHKKSKYLKPSIKFTLNNTANHVALFLEINLSEPVGTALSKLFLAVKAGYNRIYMYTAKARDKPMLVIS